MHTVSDIAIYCKSIVKPLILDVSLHFVKLFAKHATGLEIQHTLVSSAAEEKRREKEPVNIFSSRMMVN